MIAIVDYGAGNIFSVKNALDSLGVENKLTSEKKELENADKIILPGVGAFPWAMKKLGEQGIIETLKEQAKKKPFLGICLGMQVLFEKGYEFEECEGLGILGGEVVKIDEPNLVVPHMGWNKLEYKNKNCPILKNLGDNEFVYFVHSYKAICDKENLVAVCQYGNEVTALAWDGAFAYGAQFHPEKSGETGLKILKNFTEL